LLETATTIAINFLVLRPISDCVNHRILTPIVGTALMRLPLETRPRGALIRRSVPGNPGSGRRKASKRSPSFNEASGFVCIPEAAPWLAEYLHEMMVFPKGKHDDQVGSTAQFLDWFERPFPGQAFYELVVAPKAKSYRRVLLKRFGKFPDDPF
jgi:hypothetical protein